MNNKSILKLCGYSTIVGVIGGGVIALFLLALKKVTSLMIDNRYWWLIFILPFSGVMMTYLYHKFGKNSHKGNNIIIENINGSDEKINFIMAPLVFLGTVLAHLFGASVGREGTGVQIGGIISGVIVDKFNMTGNEKKTLLIAGVATGFSAVFGTPMAGTIFALEVASIGKLTYDAFLPALIGSLVGDGIVKLIGVTHTHYKIVEAQSVNVDLVLKVVAMSVCFGVVSKLFSVFTEKFKELFCMFSEKTYIRTFIGGTLMVIITLIIGNRSYNGLSLSLLNNAFNGDVAYYTFFLKLGVTTLCLGAGFQGGEVTPLFVIGATLGAVLAAIFGVPFAFAAALGLVGVFSGATKTPLASFVLGIELFSANNIVFIMIAVVISVFVSGKKGIYGSQIWEEF